MGRVWRAADEMLDRQVAVKEMRIDGLDAEDTRTRRERTLREARATARIDHPNVVRIYDVVDEGERLWIVMELVAGRSLEQIMVEEGSLGPRETARIGLGLVAALRQVHAGGVLHRDIKPGNVLVERGGGRVVLTDFGIAAIQDAKALTMVGMLVGSPDYMAPERVSGRPQGPPSDIWSLGATLCAALGGRSPFSRDTTLATLHAVLYEEPELPAAAGPLRDILAALLEKEPTVRAGLAEMEDALWPVAYPSPTPTLPVGEGPPVGERESFPAGADAGSGREEQEGAGDGTGPGTPPGTGAQLDPGPSGDAGTASDGGPSGGAGTHGGSVSLPDAESAAEAEPLPGPAPGPGPGTESEAPVGGDTPVFPWAPREWPTPAFVEVPHGRAGGDAGEAEHVRAPESPQDADRAKEAEPEPVRDAVPSASPVADGTVPERHVPVPAPVPAPPTAPPEPPPTPRTPAVSAEAASELRSEVRSEMPSSNSVVPAPGAHPGQGVSLPRAQAVTERRPGHGPPGSYAPRPVGIPPGEPPGPAAPAHPHPGRRRTALLAAAGLVAVAVVVAVLLATSSGGRRDDTDAGSSPSAAASSSAPSSPSSSSPSSSSPSSSGGTTTSSPTVEGTSRPRSLPPGAHREAGGFAWVTPKGWRRDVNTGSEVHYTSPDGRQELVGKSSLARGNLIDTWRTSEQNAHEGQDYTKLRLEETTFQGHPAVVWEYTFTLKGVHWHALLLGFDADGKSYQINTWYQPEIETQALKTYDKVKDGFTLL
ncbi:protein kinase [Streptomyces sp. NPDC086549]|uniref:serine/threonine-protein kinase n=1 Tax=Streptomyces sp. NPDC086549 TaxID=3365752 RepID=UPI00380950F9